MELLEKKLTEMWLFASGNIPQVEAFRKGALVSDISLKFGALRKGAHRDESLAKGDIPQVGDLGKGDLASNYIPQV